MKTVTSTEFRQHATAYLNAVEQGETFRIFAARQACCRSKTCKNKQRRSFLETVY